jgi:hypothetical protein
MPGGVSKLIILGDLVNKGREQIEMFEWLMKNAYNKKYVFVRGNAEVRLHNELIRYYMPNKPGMYYDWLGTHDGYGRKNISNVVIAAIEKKLFKLDDILDVLRNQFHWYHIEDKWIMAHASWNLLRRPEQQKEVNLCYDTSHLLGKLMKKGSSIEMLKMYREYKFIFGHTPTYHIKSGGPLPCILRDRFFYIDAGMFKTSRPTFFMKLV